MKASTKASIFSWLLILVIIVGQVRGITNSPRYWIALAIVFLAQLMMDAAATIEDSVDRNTKQLSYLLGELCDYEDRKAELAHRNIQRPGTSSGNV